MENLTGKKFGRLTVIKENPERKNRKVLWDCMCICGNKTTVYTHILVGGKGESCGCLANELSSKRKTKHGMYWSRTFVSWQGIVQRTTNKSCKDYAQYGAKGIYLDIAWLDFKNFLEDMGERPEGMSIDRIDNSKGYFKENCRWATPSEQTKNRSNTVWLTDGKRTMCQSDWANFLGITSNEIFLKRKKDIKLQIGNVILQETTLPTRATATTRTTVTCP